MNNLEDVKKMLEEKHKDHYKLYNLCSERSYDVSKFQNRVAYYPFDDHNPPEFSMMKTFCEDVEKWLAKNKENIAVVHCKAGKGRTGLMICAYLLHSKHKGMTTSDQVLKFYGSKRTHNDQGVTIPSQRRYVDYYAAMLEHRLQYSPVKLYLHSFVIDPVPNLGLNHPDSFIQFEVRQKHIRLYTSVVYQVKKTGSITIKLPEALLLIDDVRIDVNQYLDFLGKKIPKAKFHFWVNTFFIDQERSSYLTHESLTSRPSLPPQNSSTSSTAAAAVPSFAAMDSESADGHTATGEHSDEPGKEDATTEQLKDSPQENQDAPDNPGCPVDDLGEASPTSTISLQEPSETLSPREAAAVPAVITTPLTGQRISRSAHNSGEPVVGAAGMLGGPSDPVPLPGALRQNRSEPSQVTVSDDRLDTKSPNGSFVPNLISIPRPHKNVVLVDNRQLDGTAAVCDIVNVKSKYLSDDTLTDQNTNATLSAFNNDRKRHRSVPMMAKTEFGDGMRKAHLGHTNSRMNIQGKMMSVRLRKHQIDKADRGKEGKKFADNFNVTLFLIRPSNQTLQDEFLRPNYIAQHMDHCPGGYCTAACTTTTTPSATPHTASHSHYHHTIHPHGGPRIPPYSPDSSSSSEDESDDDLHSHHHHHHSSADNATSWSHDQVFLPPNNGQQQMAGNNNSGGEGVESGVYSCNWTLGGGEQGGHEFPVLSAGHGEDGDLSTTSVHKGSAPQPPHRHHHHHHKKSGGGGQQHNHPLLHSYSSAAAATTAASVVEAAPNIAVRRNVSATAANIPPAAEGGQQQQQNAGGPPMHGLVRNQTDSLAELCRRSTQTTWI